MKALEAATALAAFSTEMEERMRKDPDAKADFHSLQVKMDVSPGRAVVEISKLYGITSFYVISLLEKAQELGSNQSGVKGTGELYAQFIDT